MTKSSKPPSSNLDYINKLILPSLMKHPYAWPFLKPVDYVALNLPDYPKIIRQPMDFSKVKDKLRKNLYSSANECAKDISTIFSNCYLFNPPNEDVVYMALKLDFILKEKIKVIIPDYSIALPFVRVLVSSNIRNNVNNCDKISSLNGIRKLEDSDSRVSNKILKTDSHKTREKPMLSKDDFAKCSYIIKEIMSSKYQKLNSIFLHPVDVKKLNLVDYYDTIKKPMDLNTIKSKLEAHLYCTKEAFADDIELIFKNCFKYNGEESDLGIIAKKLQEVFKKIDSKSSAKEIDTQLKTVVDTHAHNEIANHEKVQKSSVKRPNISSDASDTSEKKRIFEMLNDIEKRQEDVSVKFKKVQELVMLQNSDIEELQKKCSGTNLSLDKLDNIPEFCDAGSLISNMSESILSSSMSTISNSRKRQVPNQQNQTKDVIATPKSVKRPTTNTTKHNSKKSIADSAKKSAVTKIAKATPSQKEQSNNITKTKAIVDVYQPMVYDEKKRLSININQLRGDQLMTVVEIIKLNEISLRDCKPNEYDIDFDKLQAKTLRELEVYVNGVLSARSVPMSVTANGWSAHNSKTNNTFNDEYSVTHASVTNWSEKNINSARSQSHNSDSSSSDSSSSNSSDSSSSSSHSSNHSIS